MAWTATLKEITHPVEGATRLQLSITDGVETIEAELNFRTDDPNFSKDNIHDRIASLARGLGKHDFLKNRIGKVIATHKGLKEKDTDP